MRKIEIYLQNIVFMYEEANKKNVFKKYKSLDYSPGNEVEEMLSVF